MMKTLIVALASVTFMVSPAFTQSTIEALRIKICDDSQPKEHSGAYPGYPSTWCYWW
jgi:hypothetical protein